MRQVEQMAPETALVYPKAVPGMGCWEHIKTKKETSYSIGSLSVDRYIRANEANRAAIMHAIGLMDGAHTMTEIEKSLEEELRVKLNVETLCRKLKATGLLEGQEGEAENSEMRIMGVKLLDIKIREAKPLTRKIWVGLWYFFAILYAVSLIMAVASMAFNFTKFQGFITGAYTFQNSYVLGALVTAAISVVSITLHECSHAAMAVRFGLQPSSFKVSLYGGFQPYWVMKIRGIYTVKRSRRVLIMAAGLITNVSLMVLCINGYMYFDLQPLTAEFLGKFFFSNMYIIMGSLSPFRLSDGYFIICQMLGITNLRPRVISMVGKLLRGKPAKEHPLMYIYGIIMFWLIGTGLYSLAIWAYHMSVELYHTISIKGLNILVMLLPWLFYGLTIGMFVRNFVRMMRRGE